MIVLLALLASAGTPIGSAACSDSQIVAIAGTRHVGFSEWPDYPHVPVPDAATRASRRAAAFATLGIKPGSDGLAVTGMTEVGWPADRCAVTLIDGGFDGVLESGRTVAPGADGRLLLGGYTTHPAPEGPHPAIAGALFVRSADLMTGDWRAGLWRRSDGRYTLSAYRPGRSDPPVPLMEIVEPVIGLAYLGAPDAPGGEFALLQRTGRNAYRWTFVSWDERTIRAPASGR